MTHFTARRWAARLAMLAGVGAGGCAVNPATGSRQLMLISESQEIAMGRDYDKQLAASVSQLSKQQLAQIGLAVGTIANPDFERFAGLASAGLGVLFLKYSRDAERQADDLGLRYMRRANYDPPEMPHVFEMLTHVSQAQGGGRVPEWLATHPDPENRRRRIEQEGAALPQSFSGAAVNPGPYLRQLDGLVFGTNPREGYFQGSRFFHPELRFRLTFPEGWTTSNAKQAVIAVSPEKDAAVELSFAKEPTADPA